MTEISHQYKSCRECDFYIPKETVCLKANNLGKAFEIEKIKQALSFSRCDDFSKTK